MPAILLNESEYINLKKNVREGVVDMTAVFVTFEELCRFTMDIKYLPAPHAQKNLRMHIAFSKFVVFVFEGDRTRAIILGASMLYSETTR